MTTGRENVDATWDVPLLPSEDDQDPATITNGARFGPFEPGEHVIIVADVAFRVNARRARSSAGPALTGLTARHRLPAGVWRFVIPRLSGAETEGVWVVMIGDAAGTGYVVRSLDSARTI